MKQFGHKDKSLFEKKFQAPLIRLMVQAVEHLDNAEELKDLCAGIESLLAGNKDEFNGLRVKVGNSSKKAGDDELKYRQAFLEYVEAFKEFISNYPRKNYVSALEKKFIVLIEAAQSIQAHERTDVTQIIEINSKLKKKRLERLERLERLSESSDEKQFNKQAKQQARREKNRRIVQSFISKYEAILAEQQKNTIQTELKKIEEVLAKFQKEYKGKAENDPKRKYVEAMLLAVQQDVDLGKVKEPIAYIKELHAEAIKDLDPNKVFAGTINHRLQAFMAACGVKDAKEYQPKGMVSSCFNFMRKDYGSKDKSKLTIENAGERLFPASKPKKP